MHFLQKLKEDIKNYPDHTKFFFEKDCKGFMPINKLINDCFNIDPGHKILKYSLIYKYSLSDDRFVATKMEPTLLKKQNNFIKDLILDNMRYNPDCINDIIKCQMEFSSACRQKTLKFLRDIGVEIDKKLNNSPDTNITNAQTTELMVDYSTQSMGSLAFVI